jgi:FG-GAP-like repeat/Domain of unknown function (DUF5122) beta-propeller
MAGYDLTFGNGGRAINDLGGIDRNVALAAAAEGKLIALSFVSSAVDGTISAIVVRYNADGSLDTTFNAQAGSVSIDLPLLRKIIAGDLSDLSFADLSKGLALANLLGTPTIDRIRAKFNSVRSPYPIERLIDPQSFVINPTNFGDTVLTGTDRTYTAIYDNATKQVSIFRDITSTQAADTTFGTNGKFTLPPSLNFLGSSVSLSIVVDSQNRPIVSVKGIGDRLITVVRLTPTGSIDSTFGTNGKVQLDSKIGQLINPLSVVLNTDNRLSFGDSANNDSLIAKYDISGKSSAELTTRTDFNRDAKSDILWRNNDGSVAIWQMDGLTATPKSIEKLPTDWNIAGTGDFNSDSRTDILWRNNDGRVIIRQMDGAAITATTTVGTATTDWKASGTGDFNGDGQTDLLWRNDDGRVVSWQMNGSTPTPTNIGTVTTDWKSGGTGDFNGDGQTDLLWSNDDGRVAVWQMDGAMVNAVIVGSNAPDWKIAVTGDFNGDGKTDILWRKGDGTVAEWQMNGTTVAATATIGKNTADWNIAGAGDYNGDGKADILWRNTGGGVATWQMDGSKVLAAGDTSIRTADTAWNIVAPIG